MPANRKSLLIGAAGILIILGTIGIWRTVNPPDRDLRELNRIAREGARLYSRIENFTSIDDRAALDNAIDSWEWRSTNTLPEAQAAALKSLLAEFLERRFVLDDPAAYREWRLASGFRWIDNPDQFREWCDIDILAKNWFGETVTEPFDHAYWFDKFFTRVFEDKGASDHLKSVSAGSDLGIWLVHMLTTDAIDEPFVHPNRIPEELWYGRSGGGPNRWLVPKVSDRDLLRQQGRVLIARAHFIAEARDGSRYPCTVHFHWNPIAQRWMLTHFTTNNRPWSVGRGWFM